MISQNFAPQHLAEGSTDLSELSDTVPSSKLHRVHITENTIRGTKWLL